MAMMRCKECGQQVGNIVDIGAYDNGSSMTLGALTRESERTVPEVSTWRAIAASFDYRFRHGYIHLNTYKERIKVAAAVLMGRLG